MDVARKARETIMYDYVKRAYGVNPIVGQRIRHHVKSVGMGTIAPERISQAHYVMVVLDGEKHSSPCHPTEMDYLEEVQ